MCAYCEYDDNFGLKPLRDELYDMAWLEENDNEWGIVTSVTTRCYGSDCTTETYLPVKHCPMCGRELV